MDINIVLAVPRMRQRAIKTLRFYFEESHSKRLDADEQIDSSGTLTDLLADLLHVFGPDLLYSQLSMALIHYEAESRGEL